MLLRSALWLAVVHALASPTIPAGVRGLVEVPVGVTATVAAAAVGDHARPENGAETGPRALPHGDEEFRPSTPQRLPAVDRTRDRCVTPLRSPIGTARFASADLSVVSACVAQRAAPQESHAAASRGGHLPYFPTAPPLLQG